MNFAGIALIALLSVGAPTSAAAAQQPEIVVRGDAARMEIERILDADNVDTTQLSANEVAEAIAGIKRGRAPEDFWAAYRAHVDAWARLAELEAAARGRDVPRPEDEAAIVMAQHAIEASFDEVERIARQYGARLPTPPWKVLSTV